MAAISLKTPEQNDQEISVSCLETFNSLPQQRQIKILKQLSINVRSFTQYVFAEKKVLFSDFKQLVDDSKKDSQLNESNVRQIERKYGEIIRELYSEKVSVKTIAVNLEKFEQIESADSKIKISESIVRNVVKNMNIQRADDRKKGKHKPKKKSLKKLGRSIADVEQIGNQIGKKTLIHSEQIDMSDSQSLIAEQMTEVERTDVQQIDSVDGRQIEKQIDSEIENVLLDNLGKDLAAQNQTENR